MSSSNLVSSAITPAPRTDLRSLSKCFRALTVALLCSLTGSLAWAQAQPENTLAQETPRQPPSQTTLQRHVIEDDGSRIEELRIRGEVRRISVTIKNSSKSAYEILPPDASGAETFRGTAGKRVWNILQF
jgi:hypothetical protein